MTSAETEKTLGEALDVGTGACIAIVGAGGKTTTMLSLAEWTASRGLRTLVTTTTKIWRPANTVTYLESGQPDLLRLVQHGLQVRSVVAAGSRIGPGGKLHGLAPETVCGLRSESAADVILCEADGAAGLSLKAHRPGEPVVPACATHLLVVGGLDALGQPVRRAVHRPEEFQEISGLRSGDPVDLEAFACAMLAASRFAPRGAALIFLINKTDTSADVARSRDIAARLLDAVPGSRCLATRRGTVVAELVSS